MRKPTRHTCLAAVLPLLAFPTVAIPCHADSPPPSNPWALLTPPKDLGPLPTDRIGLYVRASKLIETGPPYVDPADDSSPPQNAAAWAQRYSLVNKDAWLKRNAAGFALFDKALKAPLAPKRAATEDSLWDDMSVHARLRELARQLIADVHAREMRGDWGGAMQRRLDMIQVSNDAGAGGTVIDLLVGEAIQSIGTIGFAGSTEHLTLPEAKAAAERLGRLYSQRTRVFTALEGDKSRGQKHWSEAFSKDNWRDPNSFTSLSPAQRAELRTANSASLMKGYGAELDRQIKIAHLPYLKGVGQPKRPSDTLVAAMTFDMTSAAWLFARSDATEAMWLTTLALRAHQLERGEYPKTLRGLVPGFLPGVPLDPFSGVAPLRYHRTANSYLLWSIGPDGVDDGGKSIPFSTLIRPRPISPAAPPLLPGVYGDSKGDFVFGRNR